MNINDRFTETEGYLSYNIRACAETVSSALAMQCGGISADILPEPFRSLKDEIDSAAGSAASPEEVPARVLGLLLCALKCKETLEEEAGVSGRACAAGAGYSLVCGAAEALLLILFSETSLMDDREAAQKINSKAEKAYAKSEKKRGRIMNTFFDSVLDR